MFWWTACPSTVEWTHTKFEFVDFSWLYEHVRFCICISIFCTDDVFSYCWFLQLFYNCYTVMMFALLVANWPFCVRLINLKRGILVWTVAQWQTSFQSIYSSRLSWNATQVRPQYSVVTWPEIRDRQWSGRVVTGVQWWRVIVSASTSTLMVLMWWSSTMLVILMLINTLSPLTTSSAVARLLPSSQSRPANLHRSKTCT